MKVMPDITQTAARIRLAVKLGRIHPDMVGDWCPSFNPFAFADDDYACLVWIRNDAKINRQVAVIVNKGAFNTLLYRIGDYARALLAVDGLDISDDV